MDIARCDGCPRNCGANRFSQKRGDCQAGEEIEISWFGLHFGEEPPISGSAGSGTIFFCHCNLKCVFCQNWQISQPSFASRPRLGSRKGRVFIQSKKYEIEEVAEIMLGLQKKGAHNINLVSPTVWSYWLKPAIISAKNKGLVIPVLWNSNAYEKVEVLKEFEGLVDIYLPDYKYGLDSLALKYSSAPAYSKIAQKAIREMYRQVGNLTVDSKGIAQKGLIVRHLILPGAIENTKLCLKFIRSISPEIRLSLMSQYHPIYRACEFGEINRQLSLEEFEAANKLIKGFDFKNGWIQEFEESARCLTPDFTKRSPFLPLPKEVIR